MKPERKSFKKTCVGGNSCPKTPSEGDFGVESLEWNRIVSSEKNVARSAFVRTTYVWLLLLLTFVLVLLLTVTVTFIFCWVACFEVAVTVAELLFSPLAVVMGVVSARQWFFVAWKGGRSCQQGCWGLNIETKKRSAFGLKKKNERSRKERDGSNERKMNEKK